MTTLINGSKTEEFAINVAEYLERQQELKEAEAQFEILKSALKEHMETNGLTEVEVGNHVITLKDITRTSVDAKIAKVVIPKKYLDQAVKSTTYQQLKVTAKKD
tara:strand:- start:2667 stop:2978 length:312 start_codon:yes stop_codon:yes gene_type:complete